MSQLEQQLKNDLDQALKAKDEVTLGSLRFLKSVLDRAAKDKRADLTQEEAVNLVKKEVKKRQEAIELYQTGKRPELAQKEQAEMSLLKKYLPAEMDTAELEAIVKKVIAENNFTAKDFGQVMKAVVQVVAGRADGGTISKIVKENLS